MDMKPTTRIEITAADVDKRGYITPARLTQLMILAAMDRNRTEGGGKGPMRENFGAAWMFRRVRMEQFLPIRGLRFWAYDAGGGVCPPGRVPIERGSGGPVRFGDDAGEAERAGQTYAARSGTAVRLPAVQ